MQLQTDRTTTKRTTTQKATDDLKGKHLDTGLRVAAIRLVRERNASAEGLCIAFGISHTAARSIVRKALSNV